MLVTQWPPEVLCGSQRQSAKLRVALCRIRAATGDTGEADCRSDDYVTESLSSLLSLTREPRSVLSPCALAGLASQSSVQA